MGTKKKISTEPIAYIIIIITLLLAVVGIMYYVLRGRVMIGAVHLLSVNIKISAGLYYYVLIRRHLKTYETFSALI